MKRNNKALYESIIRNVSKLVKKALNETLKKDSILYVLHQPFDGIYQFLLEFVNLRTKIFGICEELTRKNIDQRVPSIIITLKADFNEKFYNFINKECDETFFDYQEMGYAFTTESNMVTLVFHHNAIDSELLYKMVLKIMSDAIYNSESDIRYNIYFGFFKADETDLNIEYLLNNLKQVNDTHSMDDGYLIFTTLETPEEFLKLKILVNNIPEE